MSTLQMACRLTILVAIFFFAATSRAIEVKSPNGELVVSIALKSGRPMFRVARNGRPILNDSLLGLGLAGESADHADELNRLAEDHVDRTWQPVWGKRSRIVDRHKGLSVSLGSSLNAPVVEFRVYDDAVAFRYRLAANVGAESTAVTIEREHTTLNFADDGVCWSYNGENPNVGPEQLSSIDKSRKAPLLCKLDSDLYISVYEAALFDAPWMSLQSDAGEKNLRILTDAYQVGETHVTPWRVLMIGSTPGALVDSDVLMNLNPQCKIKDNSWIKPGVCFWDWRAWGHNADGFTYDLSMPSWKRFVDFAQETGVPYLLLDANWYGPEFEAESNPTETGKVNAVRELLDYAKARDVGVLLYLNDVAGQKYDLKDVLRNYSDWGAVGIKYGFMKGGGKDKVVRTRQIIELCAKNRLYVDFHDGPIPPSGDMRTWPNCLTREFCHAQSDSLKSFTPKTFVTAAFANGLAGPIDMANGLFDLEDSVAQRPRIFEEVRSTIVAEAARSLIIFSGLNVLPDSADSYREHLELFEFIASQKMPWTESRTLQGEVGEYIVTMRQTGETYLVGAATNEQARVLSIPLDFLGTGDYKAKFYEDAADAHFESNREAYTIRHGKVSSSTVVQAALAPGGGYCIKLVPNSN